MLNVVAALFRIYCRVQDLQHNVMGSPSSPLQGRVALAKSDGPIYLLPRRGGGYNLGFNSELSSVSVLARDIGGNYGSNRNVNPNDEVLAAAGGGGGGGGCCHDQ